MEEIVNDDNIYPVVMNKKCCYSFLEGLKVIILYFKNFNRFNINATQKSQ